MLFLSRVKIFRAVSSIWNSRVCYQYRRGKDTERPELCKNQEIKVLSLFLNFDLIKVDPLPMPIF